MSIEITMPRLSDTMERGTVLKWNVAEGQSVSSGDVVADVETDKATMELTVYDDGTLAKILVGEGEAVDVGTVIAVMAEDGENVDDLGDVSRDGSASGDGTAETQGSDESASKKTRGGDDAAAQESGSSSSTSSGSASTVDDADTPSREPQRPGGKRKMSPLARRLADEHGIDDSQLTGSGPGGRIIKRDVLEAIEAAEETVTARPPSAISKSAPSTGVPVTSVSMERSGAASALDVGTVQLSTMRQTIARRLVESATTIPHYQVSMSFEMDALMSLRKNLNEQLEPMGIKLSVNDFLVRACALAMYEHPDFNASWGGDSIVVHPAVNVGMAISLPAERGGGLVVGVIRDADRKSLRAISGESKTLAEKARTRGLSVEEMSDSTFTLSNLGMFGVDHFTAIINPPNSAILAVGAAHQKPVVRDGELTIGYEMSATLSNDHRVIDGAMAARYLQTVKRLIESPAALMV